MTVVLQALFRALRQAQADSNIKAIVVTGVNGRFSAGFDVSEFASGKGTDAT